LGDYADYLSGVKLVTDQIGPFRAKNCVHNTHGKRNKWPLLIVGPNTCGICADFLDRNAADAVDARE